ncbi:RND family efflux transporter, MFP subunit [Catalinimonas alkaloidigena]|uniref:RND family efflux transporter, MFP subunit n=1 Tax=Catalinimonas alkaloidigena TaxID=1075417 RepID=A0A1G9PHQ4_9BACT|nr:efflux RND transporter periplasmic adaptor subunit [Catalinimonas alkaloidigena]SDL98310.1 RND family efflux transporter, MFP subunit [Catalinimonas alkaloidigena]
MKNTFLTILTLATLAACSSGDELEKKKAQLSEYESQVTELEGKITELRTEIAALDPTFAEERSVLVATQPVERKNFAHFIEVRGTVMSNQNITIGAETAGMVQQIPVREGERVRKGQLLASIDADVMNQNIAELKSQLELARTVFEKRERLWKQNIGTEVQYLESKANRDALESRLRSLQSQLGKAQVRAPFNGVVDEIMLREGENAMPGVPLMRIVALDEVYVEADIPEAYLGQIKQGDEVMLQFPSLGDSAYTGRIRAVSQVIKADNRTFPVEISLSNTNRQLQPNMLAVVKIKDYSAPDAVVIPTQYIRQERGQDVVFVLNGPKEKQFAKRVAIERGLNYQNETQVKSGLQGNEQLITDGFRDVVDSMRVQVVANVAQR